MLAEGTHAIPNAAVFYTAGTYTISVTSPFLPTATQTVTVVPAAAARFTVTAGATATVAGTPVAVTLTAYDAFGNLATGYTGIVAFRSTDPQAALPAPYTFTAADAGTHTFSATLKTAGVQSVTAADTGTGSVAGTSASIIVSPTAASSFSLVGGGGYVATAHTVAITARDPYGNAAIGYNNIVHVTSSDPTTVVSGDATLVNGVGTTQITPNTLGTQTLTATDTATGALTGSEAITVTPGWASSFAMTAIPTTTAGVAQSFTVSVKDPYGNFTNAYPGTVGFKFTLTVLDAYGNVATGYRGTVHLSSTDSTGGTQNYTFSSNDKGVHVFSYTFNALGYQTLNIVDALNSALVGSATVYVAPK